MRINSATYQTAIRQEADRTKAKKEPQRKDKADEAVVNEVRETTVASQVKGIESVDEAKSLLNDIRASLKLDSSQVEQAHVGFNRDNAHYVLRNE